MKPVARLSVLLVLWSLALSAGARDGFDLERLYFGAGIGFNSMSEWDSGTGVQLLSGYDLGLRVNQVWVDVEGGYMTTGRMERQVGGERGRGENLRGFWGAGVARMALLPEVEALARLGFDFGDDDGPLAGIGVGYRVDRHALLRIEYVVRDRSDSLQFNVVYRPQRD